MLNPWRLRLLARLRALGTMQAVADADRLSVSAVSQQLATLEREAGVPLLERAGRSVRLTPTGQRLVDEAIPVLDALEGLDASLRGERTEVRGDVRIGAFSSALAALVFPVVARLRDQHPRLRVHAEEREPDESMPLLASGQLDVLLAATFGDARTLHSADLRVHPVARDRLAAVLSPSHAYAAREGITMTELSTEPWALEPESTYLARHVRALYEAEGIRPDVRARTTSHASMQMAAAAGVAVTVLPSMALSPPLADVAVVPIEPASHRSIVAICSAAQSQRAGIRALIEALALQGRAWSAGDPTR